MQEKETQKALRAATPSFTPGPWVFERPACDIADRGTHSFAFILSGPRDADRNGNVIAETFCEPGSSEEAATADSCLIAAAPDLYEALRDLVGAVNRPDLPQERAARAALAKADRGTP